MGVDLCMNSSRRLSAQPYVTVKLIGQVHNVPELSIPLQYLAITYRL